MKRIVAWLMLAALMLAGVAYAEEIGEIQPKYDDGVMYVPIGKRVEVRYRLTTTALQKSGYAYETSDEKIATVDYQGNVKGISLGECTLTITSKRYPEVSAQVTVRVITPVKKIQLSAKEETLFVGQSMTLAAVCEPEDATNKAVVFSSSKEEVASVDQNGVITAHKRGKATITVESADGNASRSMKVVVEQKPEEITFKQPSYTLAVGKNLKIKPTVLPSNANNKKVTWSTSDESVATVSKNGTVKAKGVGVAVITAASDADPNVFQTVEVEVVLPIRKIHIEPEHYDLHIGDSIQLAPTFTPEDATPAVRYEASNPYIVSIDENGLVTATGGGETTIRIVSREDKSRKATVTVAIHVDVTGVSVDRKGFRLPVGEHAFGMIKVRPGDATNKNMTWTSSDPTVAIVTNTSNRPRIEGLKWGRTLLTGTTVDGGYSASFMVNVGALHEAATVYSAVPSGNEAQVVVQNHSDMQLSSVTLWIEGEDEQGNAVSGEQTFEVNIAPGAFSETLSIAMPAAQKHAVAVAGWETSTGFYTNDEVLKTSYRIAGGLMEWVSVK